MSPSLCFLARCMVCASAVWASLATLGGCSEDTKNETHQVEIFSWWVAGGEVQALNDLLAVHQQRHPGVTVTNLAAGFADKARDELRNRMASGLPPDTFQENVGSGLLDWAPNALEPLDTLAAAEGWNLSFEPAVLESVTLDGQLYAVGLNIHRLNVLFFNRQLLSSHGIAPPSTLEELHKTCLDLKEVGITPIALGNLNNWPLQEFAFECVLPAMAGPDFYNRYWTGLEKPDAPQIKEAVDYVIELYKDGCFNADSSTIDWTDALDRVAEGTAAFSEMGDWGKGYFESQNKVADENFGLVPFPGAEVFVFTSDSFPLPRGPQHSRPPSPLPSRFLLPSPFVALRSNRGKGMPFPLTAEPVRAEFSPCVLRC